MRRFKSGCGDDGDAGGEDIRDITMAGTEAGGSDGTSETPTAGTMALALLVCAPGGTDNPPVDACSEICSKYDACGKSDIGLSGSAENCIIACRTLESLPSFEDYRTCVDSKGCDDLGDCLIPSSTVAVTCADVRGAIEPACMGDRRVPAGLPQVDIAKQHVNSWRLNDKSSRAVKIWCETLKPATKRHLPGV